MNIQEQYFLSCLIASTGVYMNSMIEALGPEGKGYKHIYGWKIEDHLKDPGGFMWIIWIVMFIGIFIFKWWIPILVVALTGIISDPLAKLFHPWVIVGHIMFFIGTIYALILLFNVAFN